MLQSMGSQRGRQAGATEQRQRDALAQLPEWLNFKETDNTQCWHGCGGSKNWFLTVGGKVKWNKDIQSSLAIC